MLHSHSQHDVSHVVELSADELGRVNPSGGEQLRSGRVLVVRGVGEILEFGRTIREVAADIAGAGGAREVSELMLTARAGSLKALSVFYNALRHLRDSRYLSCLFLGLISKLGLPEPLLVDSGFTRMMIPGDYDAARRRPDWFDRSEFAAPDNNEAEHMLQGGGWGNAHRDIDVRHYHFQANFWFPLHDVDERQTLLIFPEAYRRDVRQYGKPGDPDNPGGWGFGPALQVPLRFGDMLVFHSQHLHASPSQAREKNRFTVELRVAGGCVDDNGRIYRRLFWNLSNFMPARGRAATPPVLAKQLAPLPPERPTLASALSGETAHAVVHRLFRRPQASLAAAYLHRPDEVLDEALPLDADGWRKVVARLSEFPAGEDLWLLVARLLSRQGQTQQAAEVLAKVARETRSPFWALEAGRVAARAGLYGLAEEAFAAAGDYAGRSDVTLDRYSVDMPPPRFEGTLQLLPATAKEAAAKFARLARRMQSEPAAHVPPRAFDHRYFWDPSLLQTNRVVWALKRGYWSGRDKVMLKLLTGLKKVIGQKGYSALRGRWRSAKDKKEAA